MAQKITVELVDDLDGQIAEETVSFALDGIQYQIDLTEKNALKIRTVLGPYAGAARRTVGRRRTGPPAANGGRRAELPKIRGWGRANGFTVSDRGRVSKKLQDAYDQHH